MSQILTQSEASFFGAKGSQFVFGTSGSGAPDVPTIDDVSPSPFDPSTQLGVTWSPGASGWNYLVMEVYEDSGLTILNQTISTTTISGSTSLFVGSGDTAPLSPGTQYWVRMKVRQDDGPYSAWSNTGTGTTDP